MNRRVLQFLWRAPLALHLGGGGCRERQKARQQRQKTRQAPNFMVEELGGGRSTMICAALLGASTDLRSSTARWAPTRGKRNRCRAAGRLLHPVTVRNAQIATGGIRMRARDPHASVWIVPATWMLLALAVPVAAQQGSWVPNGVAVSASGQNAGVSRVVSDGEGDRKSVV